MSASENENQSGGEEEVDPAAHKQLLRSIGQLSRNQHIRKPTRSEPALARDEFHLVKPLSTDVQTVSMGDVVNLLRKTSKHIDAGKQLSKTQHQKKILQKPLEKPVAERIQRTIGYEKVKKDLSRWDAVVERNRVAEQQVFPLDYEEVHADLPPPKKPRGTTIKSDLMLEMEAVEAKLRELRGTQHTDDDEAKRQERLTREELIARRKELAYLRIKESQKSARARQRNKIKSKKFHKFLKREKLKEQIKEFELLQKTNPEAALEKLETIEKSRVLERANLRHKNTGTWAKNLQVRAKYDKDVRKDLAEQLALSRELTQKQKDAAESSSDDEASDERNGADKEEVDPFNPWFKGSKKAEQVDEVAEFLGGYRKYWTERNANEKALEEYREDSEDDLENSLQNGENEQPGSDASNDVDESNEATNEAVNSNSGSENDNVSGNMDQSSDSDSEFSAGELEKFKAKLNYQKKNVENCRGKFTTTAYSSPPLVNGEHGKLKRRKQTEEEVSPHAKTRGTLKKKRKQPIVVTSAGGTDWVVEDIGETPSKSVDIDDIFDDAENLLQEKVHEKICKLSKDLEKREQRKQIKKEKKHKSKSSDLSFKVKASQPEIDEELLETSANGEPVIEKPQNPHRLANSKADKPSKQDEIDPSNIAQIKPKSLRTALPDMVNSEEFFDEHDLNEKVQMTIAEAFEDDDIVADFERDREDERKKTANEDVDLTLPGWGSWAGCGISKEKQTKRLILKFPKEAPRRDDNKKNVVINEDGNKKLKQHLVSDLPFPFKSVQEYEASIRAPIGRSFVPETAFRMLTRPATVTKLGTVIEPMNDEFLVKAPKAPRNAVDKRIAIMEKNKKKSK
ncbi:unnamed protein product [Hermetia illucens]|uniref:U3 small nucleolar RNA-associated protein 14 homolog A n=1 Tax=Hermetia illucens TaxID=343691 RepID=A0A7R8UK37_HERIL|nr:U3 small nucleolar RNA-associated protein 14 homolog A isoform X2 [Hermetia illucens]CAD7081999.1 unnamed protein product [Hermetia illucens]